MYSDTRPLPGDLEYNLLGKIAERLGALATPDDTNYTLLVRILSQLNSVGAGAGDNAFLTQTVGDARYVQKSGDIMSGALRVERATPLTADAPSIQVREYWNNAAVQFSAINVALTNTASNTNSSFLRGEVDGNEALLLRRNGTIRSTRHLADNFENAVQQFKRGNNTSATGAILSGAGIGSNDFQGWDGAAFALVARTVAVADENFTGAANGTHLRLYATPIGSAAAVERLRVAGARVSVLSVPLKLHGFTVAALPASPVQGDTAYVTDATAPTFLGAAVGGGAVVSPVFYNGAAWVTV